MRVPAWLGTTDLRSNPGIHTLNGLPIVPPARELHARLPNLVAGRAEVVKKQPQRGWSLAQ